MNLDGRAQGGGALWHHGDIDGSTTSKVNALTAPGDGMVEDGGGRSRASACGARGSPARLGGALGPMWGKCVWLPDQIVRVHAGRTHYHMLRLFSPDEWLCIDPCIHVIRPLNNNTDGCMHRLMQRPGSSWFFLKSQIQKMYLKYVNGEIK